MKLCVATTMLPEWTPEEAVQELKQLGYDGIEWRVTRIKEERKNEPPSFWGNNRCTLEPSDEDALRAKNLAQSVGLRIPVLGMYIPIGDRTGVEEAVHFARQCGAPQIRIGIWKIRGATYRQVYSEAEQFLTQIEDIVRKHRIKLLIETHMQTICPSASAAYRLVSLFDPDYLGVIYDPGNMVTEGYEDYRLGLDLLGPYLSHVHLKNRTYQHNGGQWKVKGAPIEDGAVDIPYLLTALKESGYDGWLSMEDFYTGRSAQEKCKRNIEYIHGLLQTV